MKLKNGATIISKSEISPRGLYSDGYVVLAQKRRASGQMEYITWITDDDLNCYHGNYYTNLQAATRNYKDRVIQYV